MADNVAITAGTGTSIATQDEGGVHYQEVKLVASGTGTTAALTKAEDAAHTSGDHGVPMLVVRADSAASLAGTDGDYTIPIVDANGKLHVNAGNVTIGAALPAGTNAIGKLAANSGVDIGDVDVTSVVPGVTATSLGKAEDAAHTSGDVGVLALAVRNDAGAALSGTDGDYTPIGVTSAGAVFISDGGGSVTIDGAVSQTGTWSVTAVPPTPDATVYAVIRPTDGTNFVAPGTEYTENDSITADAGKGVFGVMRRDNALSTLSPAEDKATGMRSNSLGALWVDPHGGGVAHGASDAGNNVKIGGRAETTFQSAVSDGQRVDALFDVYGQMFVRNDPANKWSFHLDTSSAQTDTTVQASPGAGLSLYVTDIVFSTGAATACNIFFEEGSTKVLGPWYLEATAGRGLVVSFKTPKKITAATALTVTTSASIAQALEVTGFIAP